MRTPRAPAVFALVLACLLAGCSDDPEPQHEPPPTPSGSPSAPTTSPAVADSRAGGPVPTSRAWFDRLSQAMLTGDSEPVLAITEPTCSSCLSQIQAVDETFSNGGSYQLDTVAWKVIRAKLNRKNGNEAQVTVALELSGGNMIASTGADRTTFFSERRIAQLVLHRSDSRWRLSQLAFLS